MAADEKQEERMEVDASVKKQKSAGPKVYVPGMSRSLKRSEELVYDPKAYLLLHTFETNFPCLSFDIVHDSLGNNRQTYPMTAWLVTGTQADKVRDNELLVMRLSNMRANKKTLEAKQRQQQRQMENGGESSTSSEEEEDEESSEDEELVNGQQQRLSAKEPRMHAAQIPHFGGINRIKSHSLGPSQVCAVWNGDQQKVQIWNLNPCLEAIEQQIPLQSPSKWQRMEKEKPLFSYAGHGAEGFALAWSPCQEGRLASGDVRNKIFLWNMGEGGQWHIEQRALSDHQGSVEDLVWSPTDEALLLSCSADRTIRLWDVRIPPGKGCCVATLADAHESDVNVLDWSESEPLILSGGDDGVINVWHMRSIQYKRQPPVAQFRHHKKAITSVEWSPHEGNSVFMASGEDDQTTIWDLALEAVTPGQEEDDEEKAEEDGDEQKKKSGRVEEQLPAQLLFIHMGQKEVKEVHWHPQCPGLAFTTALDGFHAFKTINS